MNTAALWMNILAFAFMASSIGLGFVIRSRKRHRWLDWYIVYALGYTVWALLFSIAFFLEVYEAQAPGWYNVLAVWVRIAISATTVLSLPLAVSASIREGRARRFLTPVGMILGAIYLGLGILSRAIDTFGFAAIINVAFNLCLGAVVAVGIFAVRRHGVESARRLLLPFLFVSFVFYAVAVSAGVVLLLRGRGSTIVSFFAVSFYCLPWAAVMLSRESAYLAGVTGGVRVPDGFIADFGITPRESEVIAALVDGRSNAEIAESQFVSVKTVESHLYNVYRKTGVKNRVGLIQRLGTYGSEPENRSE